MPSFEWGRIDRFRSRGKQLCKFVGTTTFFYITKVSIPNGCLSVHQHGRRFHCFVHQYGRRDVRWKRSIRKKDWFQGLPVGIRWINTFRWKVIQFFKVRVPGYNEKIRWMSFPKGNFKSVKTVTHRTAPKHTSVMGFSVQNHKSKWRPPRTLFFMP